MVAEVMVLLRAVEVLIVVTALIHTAVDVRMRVMAVMVARSMGKEEHDKNKQWIRYRQYKIVN